LNSDFDGSNLQVPNMRNIAPKVHHGPIVWQKAALIPTEYSRDRR